MFLWRIDQYARYRECRLALDLLVVLNRLLQGHFVDQGRNVLLFCQFAGPTAAIPVYKLVFAVLAQSEDNSLLDTADLDAGHKPAIGFILDFGDKNTGEIMDFC